MARHDITMVVSARDRATRVFKRIFVAAGAYLSFRAVTGFVRDSARAFIEQEAASRKLEQALIATGGAVGHTLGQLQAYADELQRTTIYGDEAVEGMMSILATFKNIQGDGFKRTAALALDLSTALGTDLKGSAIQLGKALNDPATGLTYLRRSGISFSQEQINVVKSLQATNRLAEAQAIILDEVAAQFGGQATAAAGTFGGQLKQLANAWSDARENIGEYLINNEIFQSALDLTIVGLQNFGTAWELVKVQAELSVRGMIGQIQHLGQVIFAYFNAYRKNWRALFIDVANLFDTILKNMFANLHKFFFAVREFIETGVWKGMNFRPLLWNFESALDELPVIADRKLTEAEKRLAARRDALFGTFSQALADRAALRKGPVAPGLLGGDTGPATAAAGRRQRLGAFESRFLTRAPGAVLSPADRAQIETAKSMKDLIREFGHWRVEMQKLHYQQQIQRMF